jgi:hypothetical protein
MLIDQMRISAGSAQPRPQAPLQAPQQALPQISMPPGAYWPSSQPSFPPFMSGSAPQGLPGSYSSSGPWNGPGAMTQQHMPLQAPRQLPQLNWGGLGMAAPEPGGPPLSGQFRTSAPGHGQPQPQLAGPPSQAALPPLPALHPGWMNLPPPQPRGDAAAPWPGYTPQQQSPHPFDAEPAYGMKYSAAPTTSQPPPGLSSGWMGGGGFPSGESGQFSQAPPQPAQMQPQLAQMQPQLAQMQPQLAQMQPQLAQMQPPPPTQDCVWAIVLSNRLADAAPRNRCGPESRGARGAEDASQGGRSAAEAGSGSDQSPEAGRGRHGQERHALDGGGEVRLAAGGHDGGAPGQHRAGLHDRPHMGDPGQICVQSVSPKRWVLILRKGGGSDPRHRSETGELLGSEVWGLARWP